jgi:hypothetical protein
VTSEKTSAKSSIGIMASCSAAMAIIVSARVMFCRFGYSQPSFAREISGMALPAEVLAVIKTGGLCFKIYCHGDDGACPSRSERGCVEIVDATTTVEDVAEIINIHTADLRRMEGGG